MALPRVTGRCERDLDLLPDAVADDLLAKLKASRVIAPESGERIVTLRERPCFSMHAGRYRAATWFDRASGVVWLLAAGVHRSDSDEDFYQVVARLEQAGTLYP